MQSTFTFLFVLLAIVNLCICVSQNSGDTDGFRMAYQNYDSSHSPLEAMGGHRGFRNVVYFVNWAIYGRKHRPQDLPVDQMTHVLYAFANVRPDSGEVYLTDSYADTEIHWEGDSWNDPGTNTYGCVKQLFKLKQRNRNLKVLLSIGGWTYSSNFAQPASTPGGRSTFAKSAVKIMEDVGFDGLDVDWEYPKDDNEAQNFVALLQEVRAELDRAEQKRGYSRVHFLLSVACPAGAQNYEKLRIAEMDRFLDFWNLMAYDYAGSWDRTAGHQSNWYPSPSQNGSTPYSTDAALKHYLRNGVRQDKVVVGMPLYGRAFQGTQGPGQPFNGVGEGSWENGVWDYKALPKSGCQVKEDEAIVASWCMDPNIGTMISYDSPQVTKWKSKLIRHYGLGGAMWWESSADKPIGQESLIETFVSECGGHIQLERQQNCLEYPESKYDNIRQPQ